MSYRPHLVVIALAVVAVLFLAVAVGDARAGDMASLIWRGGIGLLALILFGRGLRDLMRRGRDGAR